MPKYDLIKPKKKTASVTPKSIGKKEAPATDKGNKAKPASDKKGTTSPASYLPTCESTGRLDDEFFISNSVIYVDKGLANSWEKYKHVQRACETNGRKVKSIMYPVLLKDVMDDRKGTCAVVTFSNESGEKFVSENEC